MNGNIVIYFGSFGVAHIPKQVKEFRGKKYNKCLQNTRIQFNNMQTFCMGFFYFMLKGKSLLDDTNLFSLNEYGKNDKVILNIFTNLKAKME